MKARGKKSDRKEREKKLDQAIEMTFPASDPIAVGRPTSTEALAQSVRTHRQGVRPRVVTVFGGTGFWVAVSSGHLRDKGVCGPHGLAPSGAAKR